MNLTQRQSDARAPWAGKLTKEQWDRFLSHNFKHPTRQLSYRLIEKYIMKQPEEEMPLTFLEVGFGQCFDFKQCFQKMHDGGIIRYQGWEIIKQFVDYAKEEYSGYGFRLGGFLDMEKDFDIIYTRHTLEHQLPKEYEQCLVNMLTHTKKLAVISWFQSPKDIERIYWEVNHGTGRTGAWVNIYDKKKILAMVETAGFNCSITKFDLHNEIYFMERKK